MTGSAARRCDSTNATTSSTEATQRPMTTPELRGSDVPAWFARRLSATMAEVSSTAPRWSIRTRPGPDRGGRCSVAETIAITASPIGRFIRNVQRQPNRSVTTPPTVGPAREATPTVTEIQP